VKVRYRAQALADLDAIFKYLNERSPSGARNVLSVLADAIDSIADRPMASPKTSAPDVRVKILGRYRYKIFYSTDGDAAEIIHIRHAARRP
jgi:toxin ParE1/3/4